MSTDFGQLQFNPNHKQESLGAQTLNGLRLVLLSFMLYVAWAAAYILLSGYTVPDTLYDALAIAMPITAFVAFCIGAYGTHLVVDSLGWAKYISFFIIVSFLVPQLRLFALLAIGGLAVNQVWKAGYRLTPWGKPRKRATASVAPVG